MLTYSYKKCLNTKSIYSSDKLKLVLNISRKIYLNKIHPNYQKKKKSNSGREFYIKYLKSFLIYFN